MTGPAPDVEHVRVRFEMPTFEAQQRFLSEYVYDAVERLPATDDCDECIFIQADEAVDDEGGMVFVDAYGDREAIVEREQATWDEFLEAGVLDSWSHPEYDTVTQLANAFGEEGVRYQERLRYLASAMTAATHDLVEERPAPVDAFPESDGDPVGWHRVLHLLSNQWGYDIDEELDANVHNVEMGLKILGQNDSPEAARERVDAIIQRLDAAIAELEAEAAADAEPEAETAGEGEAETSEEAREN